MSNKPAILVDIYGKDAPDPAKFGVGASTPADVSNATKARRQVSERLSRGDTRPSD